MSKLKAKQDSNQYKKSVEKEKAQEIAEKLKNITLKISVKSGENQKIFGSITAKEIAENLNFPIFKTSHPTYRVMVDLITLLLGLMPLDINICEKPLSLTKSLSKFGSFTKVPLPFNLYAYPESTSCVNALLAVILLMLYVSLISLSDGS